MTVHAPLRSFSGGVWAAIAVVLVALNLRPVIVAVSPLLDTISTDLELTSFMAGLLVTLPVLCFGVLGPLAPALAARFGFERSLAGVLVAVIAGSVLRLIPTAPALFGGTLLVGAGIAVGNILLPGLIKRDFSHRLGLMSGLYSMSLAAGATLAAGVTIPIAEAAGWEWNQALAAWGLFAVFALGCWLPTLWNSRGSAGHPPILGIRLSRDKVAWFVTIALGLQSFNFYSTTAWLPTILVDHGYDAVFGGLMLSLVNLVSIVPAMLLPMLLDRMRSQAGATVVVSAFYFVSAGGLLALPDAAVLWTVLLGIAQGAGLAVALTFIVLRSPDAAHATKLSGMAQSWGYFLAAFGPLALGVLHDLSSAWTVPLLLLLVVLVPHSVFSWLAGRPGVVGAQGTLHR
ncbi:MAG TPA: MFS transporter [Terrimesophilobacter sp.]|uniref:CynX/NimT family MFS transporter n=1 Tax=Terrimesophilobacter sp. TaxID=2906435 RepID=UPI002F91DD43